MLLVSSPLLMENNEMQGRRWNQLHSSSNNLSIDEQDYVGAGNLPPNPMMTATHPSSSSSAAAHDATATNGTSATAAARGNNDVDLSADDVSGRLLPFAFRLHRMLDLAEKRGKQDIVSWLPFGRSFKVHKPEEFIQEIAPVYFNLTQYKSFQRQLLNYGFMRIESGGFVGGFYHPFFVRDDPDQCRLISRDKQKNQSMQEKISSASSFHAGMPTGATSGTSFQQNALFGAPGCPHPATSITNASPSVNRQLQPLDRSIIVRNCQHPPKNMEESKLQMTSLPPTAPIKARGSDAHPFASLFSEDSTGHTSEFMMPSEPEFPYKSKDFEEVEPYQFSTGNHTSSHHHPQHQDMMGSSLSLSSFPFRDDHTPSSTGRHDRASASRNPSSDMISILSSSGAGASTIGWLLGGGVSLSDLKSVLQSYKQNENPTGSTAPQQQQNQRPMPVMMQQQPQLPSPATATNAGAGPYLDDIISLFGNDTSNSTEEERISPTIFDL